MRSIVVGTAGHVDHGKSSLVRALTGIDPDRLQEEKTRGITIDLGFAHRVVDDVNLAFVDVPGHERFVKNMLAGAGGIDLVMLAVAADESVMPQTREHFDICRLLQVPVGMVAITKTDLVNREALEQVRRDIAALVAGSFLNGAPVVPVSVRTGGGLDDLVRTMVRLSQEIRHRPADGVVRLPIDRVFSMTGFGPVITGTLASGSIAVDQTLTVLPGVRSVKVRRIQVHGDRRGTAVAGERVALNLSGVELNELMRGQSIVTSGAFAETTIVDVVVDLLTGAPPLEDGDRLRLHHGTAETLCRVALIGPRPPAHGEDRPGRGLAQPGRVCARLRLEAAAVLTAGDLCILRTYSPVTTVAGAVVLDPHPPRMGLRTEAALNRCRRLTRDSGEDRVDAEMRAIRVMLDEAGPAGLTRSTLVTRVRVDPRDVELRVQSLAGAGEVVDVGDVIVSQSVAIRLGTAIIAALEAWHVAQPLSDGIPREELRTRIFARGAPSVFARVLSGLSSAGRVTVRERIALATHAPSLSAGEQRAREAIDQLFRVRGLTPPDVNAVAADAGVAPPIADRIIKLLIHQKVLMRADTLVFHNDVLKQLKRDVAMSKETPGVVPTLDVATFKQRFGVSRKFAIPLLEYLDRERVTRRAGDVRLIL